MSKDQIINPEKADRFKRMFGPRMKTLDNQIRLIKNCSNRDGYEWGFTDTVPYFFIVILRNLTLCAEKFGVHIEAKIDGRDVEEAFEEAEAKTNEH